MSMQSHDTDLLLNPESHQAPAHRKDECEAAGPQALMLAHESTHGVQQPSGPLAGSPAAGGIKISHPSDTFEQAAESSADRAMSSQGTATQSPATPAPPSVQREG